MRAWRGSTRAWLRVGVRVKVKGGVRVRVRDRVRVRSTRPLPLGVQHEHLGERALLEHRARWRYEIVPLEHVTRHRHRTLPSLRVAHAAVHARLVKGGAGVRVGVEATGVDRDSSLAYAAVHACGCKAVPSRRVASRAPPPPPVPFPCCSPRPHPPRPRCARSREGCRSGGWPPRQGHWRASPCSERPLLRGCSSSTRAAAAKRGRSVSSRRSSAHTSVKDCTCGASAGGAMQTLGQPICRMASAGSSGDRSQKRSGPAAAVASVLARPAARAAGSLGTSSGSGVVVRSLSKSSRLMFNSVSTEPKSRSTSAGVIESTLFALVLLEASS
eukprot:scaffold96413_cov63-Phaeocystis_antarctica.AAC.2